MVLFNILVRTCYRPTYFVNCINNILSQSHQDIRIICCYDDIRSLDYIKKINDKRFEYFFINLEDNSEMKHNLYLNHLLDKVNDGWIIFLDDDDMFSTNDSLKIINNKIINNNQFIYWGVKLGTNTIIYPPNINNVEVCKISGIGFCFHAHYKNLSRWVSARCSDFVFVKKLLESNKFETIGIKSILTQTQHKYMGLLGKNES
jgi:hypothetical protein